MRRPSVTAVVLVLAIVGTAAQPQRAARADIAEAATAKRFAAIRNEPLALLAFLREMPKGGDLHSHLSGAIYAESYLRWAADDKLCLIVATMTIALGTCDPSAGRPPVSALFQNAALYNQAVDALSMRNWNPALNGHDHFFAAFSKFVLATFTRTAEMLAEITSRAAAEHVSYLELMMSPTVETVSQFASRVGPIAGPSPDLAGARGQLLAAGFADAVKKAAAARLDVVEARHRELLHCGTPQADAGCKVTVRYIAQVTRGSAPEQVFTQMLSGFELASGAEPRVVSLNLLQPEDDPNAVQNFPLQMSMLDYLHQQYPRVPITLHAGELAEGLVPPEVLRFHIRDSVRIGHANRIGHGVDVFSEDDPFGLLKEMAAKKVLVEIALSSNDQILGVKGKRHPLRMFLEHGVPVALVTDDMGVARSSHTQEFVKAAEEHDLDYPTLKRMVRNSIDYGFADAATKTRLKADLEAALTAFERRQSARVPKS
jgi:hypothetical protein